MNWVLTTLGADRFYPFALTLNDDPVTIVTFISLYIIISLSCLITGLVLFLRAKAGIGDSFAPLLAWVFFLFGLGALINIITIFVGIYRLDIAITGALAGLSVLTAYFLTLDYVTRKNP